MNKKLDFEFDPKVFDALVEIGGKLPHEATRAFVKGGQGYGYDHPAGLALLGMKEDKVDTVVNLRMSGGCWDAPNINFDDMDKGLHKLIAADRICAGMALIRHPDWEPHSYENEEAKIPSQLKYQLHSMRNSFADITKTAWVVLHNDYFRIYRPTKTEDGRVGCREIPVKSLFSEDMSADTLAAKKIKRDAGAKARRLEEKKRREEERKAAIERQRLENEKRLENQRKREEKLKKKVTETNDKLKEGKEDIIDAGGGLVFMRGKDGKYILWQTGRRQ